MQAGSIFLIHFDGDNLLQLLDAALYLHCLRSLITETFDKVFRILDFLLLVFVSAKLLLAAFLAEHHKLIVGNLVVVNPSAGDLNGAVGHIVDESPVVADQYNGTRTDTQEVFKPLDTLDIQVVGRLVEQKHVRTTQQ